MAVMLWYLRWCVGHSNPEVRDARRISIMNGPLSSAISGTRNVPTEGQAIDETRHSAEPSAPSNQLSGPGHEPDAPPLSPPPLQTRQRLKRAPSIAIATCGTVILASLVGGTTSTRGLEDPLAQEASHDALELITEASTLLALADQCPDAPTPQQVEQKIRDLATFSDGLDVAFRWRDGDTELRVTVSRADIGFTMSGTVRAATFSGLGVSINTLCELVL